MATLLGTASAAQSSAPGPWCEVGTAASQTITIAASPTVTQCTFILPNALPFNTNLPIAVSFLTAGASSNYPIQGGLNAGLAGTVGVTSVSVASASPTTVTVAFVSNAAAVTMTAGTYRMLVIQNQGI